MRRSIDNFQVEVLGGFEDEEEEDGEAFGMEGMDEANHGDENNIMAVQGEDPNVDKHRFDAKKIVHELVFCRRRWPALRGPGSHSDGGGERGSCRRRRRGRRRRRQG